MEASSRVAVTPNQKKALTCEALELAELLAAPVALEVVTSRLDRLVDLYGVRATEDINALAWDYLFKIEGVIS